MTAPVDLEPVPFAALIAPAIDRVFAAAMRASRSRGGRELVEKYGGREAVGLMIDLRNVLAGGRDVGPEIVHVSPYLYRETGSVFDSLARSATAGLLETFDGPRYVASSRGGTFLDELIAQQATVLGERWADHADRVDGLNRLIGRLLATTEGTGGAGWATYSPVYEPAESAPQVVLLNRLQLLRHHRADAHIAAWRAAGLTAQEIVALPAGMERDGIENDTNVRAAAPYAQLSASDRLRLLADLAGLP